MAYNSSSRDNGRSNAGSGSRGDSSAGSRPVAYRNSNERISTRYRSPPLTSRVPVRRLPPDDQHRSRRDMADLPPSEGLSPFYRERFGSHSPEDYLNLRISQFDKSLTKEAIRRLLEKEFEHLAPFEIKIVPNPDDDQSLAYVNFARPDCAKSVRRALIPRMQKVFGRRIALDPAGVIRDQDGKYIPDRYNRAAMAAVDREETTPHPTRRRSPPGSGGGGGGGGSARSTAHSGSYQSGGSGRANMAPRRDPPSFNLNQDDGAASRTLFVGNLPGDVRESELRRVFEVYGVVDDVGIKVLADSNAAYSFILYRTVEESMEAMRCQHNKPVRPGSTRCMIGYGKSQVSSRLIVGGLGAWASAELLNKEFDRYGQVDELDYEPGAHHAYIRFAEQEAAADACARMKNFPLGGLKERITVDFVKDERRGVGGDKRGVKRGRSPNGNDDGGGGYDYASKRSRAGRSPSASPGRSPSEVGYVKTTEELREMIACTWKGVVMLKKAEYPLALHRLFGREHILQDLLRDETGVALKLGVNQRLPLDTNFYQKMIDLEQRELALMLAVEQVTGPQQQPRRPIDPLVKYLMEKNAAGVVTIEGGVVYVLAPSKISELLLKFFAPRFASLYSNPDINTLLIAVRKTSTNAAPPPAAAAPPATHADKFAATFTSTTMPPPPMPLAAINAMKQQATSEDATAEPLRNNSDTTMGAQQLTSMVLPPPPPPSFSNFELEAETKTEIKDEQDEGETD